MELIISPNSWSCVPCSFAMALGIKLPELLHVIGHDGSKILWPDLPDPQRRRTFHIQECIAAAFVLGVAVTEHQFSPILTPDGIHFHELPIRNDIHIIMQSHVGVLYGNGVKAGHAVAWNRKQVYDPAGWIYDIENQATFVPRAFMSFTNIKSK